LAAAAEGNEEVIAGGASLRELEQAASIAPAEARRPFHIQRRRVKAWPQQIIGTLLGRVSRRSGRDQGYYENRSIRQLPVRDAEERGNNPGDRGSRFTDSRMRL
jgi:hypothetical protein